MNQGFEMGMRAASLPKEKKPEPLDSDQREALVELIQAETPLRKAVEEAARDWSEKDLEKALNVAQFHAIWKEKCLGEGDQELKWEAERCAGAKKVESVLNPEADGFGEL